MTWSEWVEIYFDNQSDKALEIKNFKNTGGWLYVAGDSGRSEMSADQVQGLSIASRPREDPGFGNTGYSGWMKGCEGSLDLYIKDTQDRVCSINWNCPYWSKQNSFNILNVHNDWRVKRNGGMMYATAIGSVYLKIERPT